MIRLEPLAEYNFEFDKIWFGVSIFAVLHNKFLTIYKYPNAKLKSIKINKDIESVKITNKIQILYKNNKSIYPEDLVFDVPFVHNKNFTFKSKKVYYKNKPVFFINGEYNVIIHENELKAYQYVLKNDIYVIYEFDLYILHNGYIFDETFFVRFKLKYDQNFMFQSNGKDFCFSIDDLLVLNFVKKKQITFRIENVVMSNNNILITGQDCQIVILDMNLEVVMFCNAKSYFYNKYIGFICATEIIHNKIACKNTIDEYGLLIQNNVDKSYNYDIDHKIVEAIKNVIKKSKNMRNKTNYMMCCNKNTYIVEEPLTLENIYYDKLYFTISDNKIIYYKIKDNTFSILKHVKNTTNNIKTNVLDLIIEKLDKIDDVEMIDVYLEIILIVTTHHVVLVYNDYVCRKNKVENVNDCNAKNLTISSIKNNQISTLNIFDMYLTILSQSKLKTKKTIDAAVLAYSEGFIHRMLMQQMYKEVLILTQNIENNLEELFCKLYRKGDDNIRAFFDEQFKHVFNNIKSANNLFYIYNCRTDISIDYFTKLCTVQNRDDLIADMYKFISAHVPEKLIDLKSALWETNNIKMLEELKIVDLSKYTNLSSAVSKF